MEERFNIAEALRNAPKGLELWSDVHGEVTLHKIEPADDYPIILMDKAGTTVYCTSTGGHYIDDGDIEYPCTLWSSKDHRSWSGWQDILLKAGDVVVNKNNNNVEIMRDVQTMWADNGTFHTFSSLCSYRYATPEEREQFFKELEANGYKWNGEDVVKIETDEEYINKKIEQATPKWEGVDVDEYLKEIRGENDIDGILTRLDRIYNLLFERLPIIPHIETSPYPPRPTEPWYKSPLNDVQANTGKEE